MKKLFLAFGGLLLVLLSGCSVSDQSSSDVARTFQEGIHGHGQLIQPDQAADQSAGPVNP